MTSKMGPKSTPHLQRDVFAPFSFSLGLLEKDIRGATGPSIYTEPHSASTNGAEGAVRESVVALKIIRKLNKILDTPLDPLVEKFSVNEVMQISDQMKRISTIYKDIKESYPSGKDDRCAEIESELRILENHIDRLSELRTYKMIEVQNNESRRLVNWLGGIKNTVYSHTMGAAAAGATWLCSNKIETDLDKSLKESSKNSPSIVRAFASLMATYVVATIKDHLQGADERAPEARLPFLKQFYDDLDKEHPSLTPLGRMLSSLLSSNKLDSSTQELSDGEAILKKTIELNLLNILDAFFKRLTEIEEKDQKERLFFVELVHRCLEIFNGEEISSELSLNQSFLNGKFIGDLVTSLLDTIMPNKAQDLILPSTVENLFALYQRYSKDAQLYKNEKEYIGEKYWEEISSGLNNLLFSSFRNLINDSSLKNSLLLNGIRELDTLFFAQKSAHISNLKTEQEPTTASDPVKVGAGAVFVFFQIFFSTIGNSLVKLFGQKKIGEAKPNYKKQAEFNQLLESLFTEIEEHSSSWLFRYIIRKNKKDLSNQLGEQLVEQLQKLNLKDLAKKQLENAVKALFPDARLENDTFICSFTSYPSNYREINDEKAQKKAARERLISELDEAKERFGSSFEPIVDLVWELYKYSLPEEPKKSASLIEWQMYKVKKTAILFFNQCVKQCIRFGFWAIRGRSKLQEILTIFQKKVAQVNEDSMIFSLSKYLWGTIFYKAESESRVDGPSDNSPRDNSLNGASPQESLAEKLRNSKVYSNRNE